MVDINEFKEYDVDLLRAIKNYSEKGEIDKINSVVNMVDNEILINLLYYGTDKFSDHVDELDGQFSFADRMEFVMENDRRRFNMVESLDFIRSNDTLGKLNVVMNIYDRLKEAFVAEKPRKVVAVEEEVTRILDRYEADCKKEFGENNYKINIDKTVKEGFEQELENDIDALEPLEEPNNDRDYDFFD